MRPVIEMLNLTFLCRDKIEMFRSYAQQSFKGFRQSTGFRQ